MRLSMFGLISAGHQPDCERNAAIRRSALSKAAGAFGLALFATACATVVEDRVETGLVDAGIPADIASCMAPIWTDELSTGQIRGISRFASSVRAEEERLTVGRLIDHVREWNDPQALGVITTSAARCAFR